MELHWIACVAIQPYRDVVIGNKKKEVLKRKRDLFAAKKKLEDLEKDKREGWTKSQPVMGSKGKNN